MAEEGIDITEAAPALLSTDAVREADAVITMGSGDACPIFAGKRYEDWGWPTRRPVDRGRTRRAR